MESGVCDDSKRPVKLFIEAHEPQGIEGLYIREGPAIKAAPRDDPKSTTNSAGACGAILNKNKTHLLVGALMSGRSSSCGAAYVT